MEETMLTGESRDIVSDNISKLKEIFPEVITEDKIDFEKLKLLLGEDVETGSERYSFTWPGKTQAIKESQKQSTGTLRPCKEESKNWDTTGNLYIEGDNLEVLKLLQKSYYGKIKAIYIDPPYNTGKEFVYSDDYKDNLDNYLKLTGQVSVHEERGRDKSSGENVVEDRGRGEITKINERERESIGIKLSTNTETQGRYHSNWLNMMYPRLKLARNLLTEDGGIFISIDENELSNLKKICDEIFGNDNLITTVTVRTGGPGGFKTKANKPVKVKEYLLFYAKNINYFKYSSVFVEKEGNWDSHFQGFYNYENNEIYSLKKILIDEKIMDEKDKLSNLKLDERKFKEFYLKYKRNIFDTKFYKQSKEKEESLKNKNIVTSFVRNDGKTLYLYNGRLLNFLENSIHLTENKDEVIATQLSDVWIDITYNNIQNETDIPTFANGQKPLKLIKRILNMTDTEDEVILDFFSGSSSTAHAIFQQNILDKGKRKFIMVQIPEATDEKSEAYKAGYENICEIGKERIRRAGDKIVEESRNNDLDIGFKVFKLDSSNLKKWDPDYNNLEQTLLTSQDNIKSDRTQEDLIYEIMLKYGIDLTLPIEKHETQKNTIYSIGFGALVICLDNNITKEIASEILSIINDLDESRVVFKDNGFASDSDKTNIKEILKTNNVNEFITI